MSYQAYLKTGLWIGFVCGATLLSGCSSQLKYDSRNLPGDDSSKTQSLKKDPITHKTPCPSTYRVKAGDTLSEIAFRCDVEMQKIARVNDLLPPYIIYINQALEIPYALVDNTSLPTKDESAIKNELNNSGSLEKQTEEKTVSKSAPSSEEKTQVREQLKPTVISQAKPAAEPPAIPQTKQSQIIKSEQKNATARTAPVSTAKAIDKPSNKNIYRDVKWQWPMHSGLAYKFRRDRAGLSVLEIYGVPGQTVSAVAPGKVVYAGNGIANYGWMLVIKHANDFMSIYAHNSSLLVAEGDVVDIGDQVALLGATGDTKRPKLYLEARYQGRKYDIKKKLRK